MYIEVNIIMLVYIYIYILYNNVLDAHTNYASYYYYYRI